VGGLPVDTTPYAHRYADIILNSDYSLYREVLDAVAAVRFDAVVAGFERENEARSQQNKQPMKGDKASSKRFIPSIS
jgi:hypothetical protein